MAEDHSNHFPRTAEEAGQALAKYETDEEQTVRIREQTIAYSYLVAATRKELEMGKITPEQHDWKLASIYVRKDLEMEELYQEAKIDKLTRLPNRAVFEEKLEELIRSGKKFGLLVLDLDNFKIFNDTYGHDAGDSVLIQAALRMRSAIRQAPVEMPGGISRKKIEGQQNDVACRYGGEEFVVLAEDIEDEKDLLTVAERIRARFSENEFAVRENGVEKQVPVTVSIGGAVYRNQTPAELFSQADGHLYEAKNAGRNMTMIRPRTT